MAKRGRKPSDKSYDTLTIRVPPQLGREVDLWAQRAGLTRSELGRWVWAEAVAKMKRNGRHWLRQRVLQGQNDERAAARGLTIIRPRKGGRAETTGEEDAKEGRHAEIDGGLHGESAMEAKE
ncbi:MAG: hypothetical protein EPO21_13010 [Chloroflexota bacterium]|nr:MAG: hypothetical protein EPO21_13010 [Chloroflexota bacterium]